MTIHVQTWSGACNGRITDMTHSGKRGKRCRVLRFAGFPLAAGDGNQLQQDAKRESEHIMGILSSLDPSWSYDDASRIIRQAVSRARVQGIPESDVACYDEEIRGVDAPLPKLVAGNDRWSAVADESGLMLRDLTDQWNEPAACTPHGQEGSQAYRLAAKVWEQLAGAATMSCAMDILRNAGCKLHYWCMVD